MNYGTLVAELRLFETVCRHSDGKGEIALLVKNAADAIEGLDDICQHQADEIRELKKAVLRLENESGIYDELPTFYIYPTKWIPVTERLPNCNGCYLVWRPHFFGGEIGMPSICYFDGSNTWHDSYGVDFARILQPEDVTHWMPLPEPPKDGE